MKRGTKFRRIAFWSAVALSAWGWFGVSSQDETDARRFDQLAAEWQRAPEFRAITLSYCDDGSRALAAKPFGLRANDVVMALRSIPGLPKDLAVNPTSALHYRRFAMGPLCAYLHLCTEQDVPTFARVLEEAMAKRSDAALATTLPNASFSTTLPATGPAADDLTPAARELIGSFHMDEPVRADVGAMQSAAMLIRDVNPRRPFAVRQNIDALLLPCIGELARELGAPERVDDMTPEQQRWVFQRLDARVRARDPELWRTKQLSDFCCGIWAQVYGPSYGLAIEPILYIHKAAGIALLCLVMWALWRRGRIAADAAAALRLRHREGSGGEPGEPGTVDTAPVADPRSVRGETSSG